MRRRQLEVGLERHFCDRMLECGWLNDKLDKNAETKAGNQDRVFWGYKGRAVFVEFKRDGARRGRQGERLQTFRRGQLQKLGFECYEARGRLDAAELFKLLTGENLYGGKNGSGALRRGRGGPQTAATKPVDGSHGGGRLPARRQKADPRRA